MIRAAVISLALIVPSQVLSTSFVALAYDAGAMVAGTGLAEGFKAAQDAALTDCGQRAANCKLSLTAANKCVALAIDPISGGWGSFSSAQADQIEQKVVDHCASFGNENCILVEKTCAATLVETE